MHRAAGEARRALVRSAQGLATLRRSLRSTGGCVTAPAQPIARRLLRRRGLRLEYTTLAWNVVGVVVIASAALQARSVALAGFGLDSLIEIFASVVVVWELKGSATEEREQHVLRLIGIAFVVAVYIAVQATYVLATGAHPETSVLGIAWTGATCLVMLCLRAARRVPDRRSETRCCEPRDESP